MNADREPLFWKSNSDWWTIVDDRFVLTDKAPQRAKDSFELWSTPPNPDAPYVS